VEGDLLTVAIVVGVALAFDFTNGFHDTANVVATSVSTRAMPPRLAVGYAAILNFVGAFISLQVAATVAEDVVNPASIGLLAVFGGLVAAIAWNLVTWYFGLPSSSSHALIGGIVGAVLVSDGADAIFFKDGVLGKVMIPALVAPTLAFAIAGLSILLIYRIVGRLRPGSVTAGFRAGQVISGGMLALAHGTNDAQKTMGVIALALVAHGNLPASDPTPPTWVVVSAATAIALGTYAGGWRIIKTMGTRIAKIDPPQGFAAQTTCAGILWTTAHYGFPVSTTQTITGCVMGAGASRRFSAVRWGIAGNIAVAWILTLPAAAFVGATMELVTRMPAGNLVVFVLAGTIAAGAFIGRRYETRRLLPAPA
jgi:inorganic phosphate transporter, PiT family